jgi:hypothetical protein
MPVPPFAAGSEPETAPDVVSWSAPNTGYADDPELTNGIPDVAGGVSFWKVFVDAQTGTEY